MNPGFTGHKHSEENKQFFKELGKHRKGMKFSDEWRANMSKAAKNRKNRSQRKKKQQDPEKVLLFKMAKVQRRLLGKTLEKIGGSKQGHTNEQLGYSSLELKIHLESLFQEGMTRENYGCKKGQWNIDHIRPITKWPLQSNPAEVNALENLQPMWASENVRKSNEWEKENGK